MTLYRINTSKLDPAEFLTLIGIGALVVVEPIDRRWWCFSHDTQWWDECDSSCDIGELVRVPKEDNE